MTLHPGNDTPIRRRRRGAGTLDHLAAKLIV